MLYQLPSLPYKLDALEPFIDAHTLDLHHGRHHAAYVAELNQLVQDRNSLARLSLEEIVSDIRKVPEDIRQDVRNNAGGHLNHSLLWHIMGPHKGGEPTGPLMEALCGTFGSWTIFKDEFTSTAMERFGAGWCWLCIDLRGRMEIVSTANEDSPIMMGCRPVLGVDLWEHAYYLTYQDRKADYLAAWWNLVDWHHVAELHAHCLDRVARVR